MRVTSKGQVTIPIEIREKLGIQPHSEVEFELRGDTARLKKVASKSPRSRSALIVARLKGTATTKMTTDEILALMRGKPDEDYARR